MVHLRTLAEPGPVLAVLGPTNTGKTHYAVERLLGHKNGIIGLPLRLLAREIYDRIVGLRGKDTVALITGEEKIVPPDPQYFVCTVEAMPLDRPFEFVAIDEIQLCADPERGHIFTDRLFYARGASETLFLGADTMQPLLRRLIPGVRFLERTRLSSLRWSGAKKISRLPRRSAIVAFSAADVYATAELIRRQRGGAAVVMGALSPRTRNAQVEMFEAGEVDYLVATDAIGMGLNLNVDHIAFSALSKFDGRLSRDLTPAEIGQIAGRAGRHMNDGTFGVTANCAEPDIEIIERVEAHEFRPVKHIFWRNSQLDLSSPTALLQSLEAPPPGRMRDVMLRPHDCADLSVLKSLLQMPEIKEMAKGLAATDLLWQVCQVPDFRKTMAEAHARLLARLYRHLADDGGLPADWVSDHLKRLDKTDGDIDTLATRLAHIRTWTFISHRADWLEDAVGWQMRAREIEDRLSDALHQQLTQRFVDQRAAALVRSLGDTEADLLGGIKSDGEVQIEGFRVGQIEGLQFVLDMDATSASDNRLDTERTLRAAARPLVSAELARRARLLSNITSSLANTDPTITIQGDGQINWLDIGIAQLSKGETALRPGVKLLANDLEDLDRRSLITALDSFVKNRIEYLLQPLVALTHKTAAGKDELGGAARGLVFQLQENFGNLPRSQVNDLTRDLPRPDRQALRRAGVRIGAWSVFVPALLKAKRSALCGLLWTVFHRPGQQTQTLPAGRVSLPSEVGTPLAWYAANGYRPFGEMVVRIDIVERVADLLRGFDNKPFEVSPDMLSLPGCSKDAMEPILTGLGYIKAEAIADQAQQFRRPSLNERKRQLQKQSRQPHSKRKTGKRPEPVINPDSPFAGLKEMMNG
ncbi:MAG: disulfide oxidoreductase [Alphaproteobacteria bacterium]|jgi:ATP-dependent RNA helicase SUPV3L1/SUV3|nr:disulfide oxidoreductase [Alphaproteobacteria bacterium]MBT4967155.1 disulfide oxidoreductase [Alphaproteobacteria bacterium]MBT5158522.1 disulfide oxidoreductase [Alphaproteobacteria bacterium]